MDKKILRLLIVDDSPDDSELAVASLRKAGYMLKNQRVQDLASMQAALDKGTWDVVLSEYTLPHFGAQLALDLVKRAHLDIPFLVVTRNIRDPDLVKIMRNGAHDVVLKSQSARLAPAVERELHVAEERRKHQKMSLALNEVENKNRAIIEGSREAICYCLDGMHIDANKAYLEMFGYQDLSELEGVPVLNLVDKSEHVRFKDYLRKINSPNPPEPQEFLAAKKGGQHFHAELAISPIVLNGESCTQFVVIDVSKRKAVENRLQYLNQHDPLTGLYNRHHFTQELSKALEKVKQDDSRSALLYLDLNELKDINDSLGHAAGDRLLLKIARMFRDKLGESTILARFSGDEFTALLHGMNDSQIKEAVASMLSSLKETTFSEGGKTFRCDGTIGVVVIDKNSENAQAVLNKAYQTCQGNRPSKPTPVAVPVPATEMATASKPLPAVEVHATANIPALAPAPIPVLTEIRRPAPAISAATAHEWEARLKTALEKDGFQLAYQPTVNLHGDPAEYFEVLLRLPGRNGELIHAGEFMPAAEQLGLLAVIDRWVIRQSVQSLAALHREGRQASFFINLSPVSLGDPELLSMLQKQIAVAQIKPEYLVLEADEPAVMANPSDAAMFMQAVRRIGCRFAIDNFGNNLSTLNRLRDMPVDFLKISGSLIRNLSTDVLTRTSLKAIIDLAKSMNKQTIAKFVEKADDLGVLWNLGFDYVQGNYFQQADAHTDYTFADETTLATDTSSPTWANSRR
ncbi:MAG: EAL domain-containing protein [Sulfuricaulis sp.]|uniref:putative bifunctional diguanylate cyclase/phosphodiesterase n=1 Tax=Sulfuricaulis sp. TaxID=2003553 RepID=UPI0025D10E35|nr:EAL domain-containing protein [Sulfuricaulis sp.]MCR4348138.1 EAL domain-containing protein [Sulfuricaulis sp.]